MSTNELRAADRCRSLLSTFNRNPVGESIQPFYLDDFNNLSELYALLGAENNVVLENHFQN